MFDKILTMSSHCLGTWTWSSTVYGDQWYLVDWETSWKWPTRRNVGEFLVWRHSGMTHRWHVDVLLLPLEPFCCSLQQKSQRQGCPCLLQQLEIMNKIINISFNKDNLFTIKDIFSIFSFHHYQFIKHFLYTYYYSHNVKLLFLCTLILQIKL